MRNILNVNIKQDIDSEFGRISFISDKVLLLEVNKKININIQNGVLFRNEFIKLTDNKKVALIVDARDVEASVSVNSLRFFTIDPIFNRVCIFQAIIVNSIPIRLLANFYVKYLKKKAKAKVFNNYENALIWIDNNIDYLD